MIYVTTVKDTFSLALYPTPTPINYNLSLSLPMVQTSSPFTESVLHRPDIVPEVITKSGAITQIPDLDFINLLHLWSTNQHEFLTNCLKTVRPLYNEPFDCTFTEPLKLK